MPPHYQITKFPEYPQVRTFIPLVSNITPLVGTFVPLVSNITPLVLTFIPLVSNITPLVLTFIPLVSDITPLVGTFSLKHLPFFTTSAISHFTFYIPLPLALFHPNPSGKPLKRI